MYTGWLDWIVFSARFHYQNCFECKSLLIFSLLLFLVVVVVVVVLFFIVCKLQFISDSVWSVFGCLGCLDGWIRLRTNVRLSLDSLRSGARARDQQKVYRVISHNIPYIIYHIIFICSRLSIILNIKLNIYRNYCFNCFVVLS